MGEVEEVSGGRQVGADRNKTYNPVLVFPVNCNPDIVVPDNLKSWRTAVGY